MQTLPNLHVRSAGNMAIFNFELFVDVEADNFESALSWLKSIPLERQLDFHIIDYKEMEIN